jgi:hypothetical protein
LFFSSFLKFSFSFSISFFILVALSFSNYFILY